MGKLFLPLFSVFILAQAYAQQDVVRHLNSKLIGKDSVNMYYDEQYNLIEPQCAEIIRYGHFDVSKYHFTGDFKDVSRLQPTLVIAQGHYSAEGLKTGEFSFSYLDGTLLAKGHFINGDYDGEWVFYYPNGKLKERSNFKKGKYEGHYEHFREDGNPSIDMNIKNEKCSINNAWDTDGKKVVSDGGGNYAFYDGALTWEGTITKGMPDGIWSFQISDEVYGSEVFKNGRFELGRNKARAIDTRYDDKSHIIFLPKAPMLSISHSEVAAVHMGKLCDGTDYTQVNTLTIQVFDSDVYSFTSRKLSGVSVTRSH